MDGFRDKRPAADWMFSLADVENANWEYNGFRMPECWWFKS
jgi:hypothetical protein